MRWMVQRLQRFLLVHLCWSNSRREDTQSCLTRAFRSEARNSCGRGPWIHRHRKRESLQGPIRIRRRKSRASRSRAANVTWRTCATWIGETNGWNVPRHLASASKTARTRCKLWLWTGQDERTLLQQCMFGRWTRSKHMSRRARNNLSCFHIPCISSHPWKESNVPAVHIV